MMKNQKTEPKIGMRVRVIGVKNEQGEYDGYGVDEYFPRRCWKRTGTIISFENVDVGARPKDPFVYVEFAGRKRRATRDGFWTEELELIG